MDEVLAHHFNFKTMLQN